MISAMLFPLTFETYFGIYSIKLTDVRFNWLFLTLLFIFPHYNMLRRLDLCLSTWSKQLISNRF